jgi:hypothetical protein
MKTITIGSEHVKVNSREFFTPDFCILPSLQCRFHDNRFERARKLVASVKARGSTQWDDNLLAVMIKGILYLLDGFARLEASKQLAAEGFDCWKKLIVDVVVIPEDWAGLPMEYAEMLARRVNLEHKEETPNDTNDRAIIADGMKNRENLGIPAIAKELHCGEGRVKYLLAKAVKLRAKRDEELKEKSGLRNRLFDSKEVAFKKVRNAMCLVLNKEWDTSSRHRLDQQVLHHFNFHFHLLVASNEKQVNALLRQGLELDSKAGDQKHYILVIFYSSASKSSKSNSTATNHFERVKELLKDYAPSVKLCSVEARNDRPKVFDRDKVKAFIAEAATEPAEFESLGVVGAT